MSIKELNCVKKKCVYFKIKPWKEKHSSPVLNPQGFMMGFPPPTFWAHKLSATFWERAAD